MVDRHILTAVKRFGPVSAAEIGVLMGLQAEMVESSLSELSRVGVALRHDANAWSLPEDAEIQHFYVEQDNLKAKWYFDYANKLISSYGTLFWNNDRIEDSELYLDIMLI